MLSDASVSTHFLQIGFNTTSGANTSLIIEGGAILTGNDTRIGEFADSNGTIIVTGTNSTFDAVGLLAVGFSGNGTMIISNGGTLTSDNALHLGFNTTGSGNLSVSGIGSSFVDHWGEMNIGNDALDAGGTGNFTVSDGGYASVPLIYINSHSGNSSVNVTGQNSHLAAAAIFSIGTNATTTLSVSNGGNLTTSTAITTIAEVSDPGSIATFTGNFNLKGGPTPQSLTIANGGQVVVGGVINLAQNTGDNSAVNLNGGTLRVGGVGGIATGPGNYTFNLAGGILQVIDSDLTTSINAALVNSTNSTVDTDDFNATWSGVLSGGGNLVKDGHGTLTLAGNNTYGGTTTISAGTLLLANSLALQNSTLNYNVGNGNISFGNLTNVTLGGLSGNQDISLYTPAIAVVNLTVGTNNASTTYSGSLSPSVGLSGSVYGSLTKVGNGTLTLTGNLSYAGGTNVEGGTLVLSGATMTETDLSGIYVDNASVVVQNDSTLNIGAITLRGLSSDNSRATITGANTTVNARGLTIGFQGQSSLTIANGANVTVATPQLGGATSGNGMLTVTDAGSKLTFVGADGYPDILTVGNQGNGTLTVANGAVVAGNNTVLGGMATGTGNVTITGANSTLNLAQTIEVGGLGNGSLTIANGGSVADLTGYVGGQNGVVNISDTSSQWNTTGNIVLANSSGDHGTITQAGGTVNIGGALVFGAGNGTYNLQGGTLQIGGNNGIQSGSGQAAFNWAGGILQVTGADLTTSLNATLVNATTSTINTNGFNATWSGVLTGNGNLTKAGNGTLTLAGNNTYGGDTLINNGTIMVPSTGNIAGGNIAIGQGAGMNGALTVEGGVVQPGNILVGDAGNGTLTIANGGFVNATGNVVLGNQTGSQGTLAINSGGMLQVGGQNGLAVGSGTASISLDGGILQAPAPPNNTFGGGFFFGGGITFFTSIDGLPLGSGSGSVAPDTASNDLTVSANMTLNNTNSMPNIIDTNGSNITLSGVIGGNGSLEKISNGTLTLSANNTYTGDTIVLGGTLTEDANGSIAAASNLIVDGSNATIDLGSNRSMTFASVTLANGGTIAGMGHGNLTSGNLVFNGTATGDSILTSSSDFQLMNGTATAILAGDNIAVIKTGSGVVTLTNNNTYTGGTVIDAGLINFNSGNNFGPGNLTLNGGGLQWAANNTLDISSRISPLTGNSTFDTNGNNVTFATVVSGNGTLVKAGNGTLTLAANNTYTGGTLVTGGLLGFSSLANFGPGNLVLSGGGVQWAPNYTYDISSYVNPLGDGNDTFDTNGNDITFHSVIAGSGALVKAGNGTLTLTLNNTYTGGTVLAGGLVSFISRSNFGPGNLTLSGGGLQWIANNPLDISGWLNPLGPGNDTFDTNGNDLVFSTNITGNGTLVKAGLGNLTLAGGNNSYTGGTAVSSGELILNGTIGGLSGGNLTVGNLANTTATLLISHGGSTQGAYGYIGSASGANGFVSVEGANSSIQLADVVVGNNGGAGNLAITHGAIYMGNMDIGWGNDSLGAVLVSDPNSTLDVANSNKFITVGEYGGNGSLTVANGANVNLGGLTLAFLGGQGNVLVTGVNSSLKTDIDIHLGEDSGVGNLTVANGGNVVEGRYLYIGDSSGAAGNVLVTDTNSTLTTSHEIYLNNGSLTVANGGTVTSGSAMYVYNGNAVVVTGANSRLNVSGGNGGLQIGAFGAGTLMVANGGYVNGVGLDGLTLGNNTAANGTAVVTGAYSTLNMSEIVIGNNGTGSLTVANGGNVIGNEDLLIAIGSNTTGTVQVTDAGSTMHMVFGINVGVNGVGNLTVANGGQVTDDGYLALGSGNNGTLLMNGTGSTLSVANNTTVGNYGTGNLTLTNGSAVNLSGNLLLAQQAGSHAMVNLNGGTLAVGRANGIQAGAGNYAFNFGGGTLQVAGSDLTTSINATLVNATTSTINTNGFNATWSGVLSGNGNLTKAGNGTLILAGNNTYTGNTTITFGTLRVSNNGAISATGAGAVGVLANGALAGAGKIGGNATVDGQLQPGQSGNAGLLTFGSSLTLGADAVSLFNIGGTTPATQSSAINVGGNLTLGGTFMLDLINSYIPALNDLFTLLSSSNALAGAFSGFVLPSTGNGLDWNVSQLDTTGNVTLAAPTTFADWTADSGLSGNNALPAARPFGGLPNLVRYAMNLELTGTPAGVPQIGATSVGGTNYMVIQYRVRKNMTDCQLVPQYSADLAHWTNVDAGSITQLADADTYTAQYQASVACPNPGTVFLRVVAQPTP